MGSHIMIRGICCLDMVAFIVAILMMSYPLISTRITLVTARPMGKDEIDVHLNRLNKPAVKTIMLEDGDIVDCVDIYKQPAFDHPRLKDHKIIMSPSNLDKNVMASSNRQIIQPAWEKSEGCPSGTIPILRVKENDLLRATCPLESFGRLDNETLKRVERAGAMTDDEDNFRGALARINLWGVQVEDKEWSQASIEISDYGLDLTRGSFIEGGWLVHPELFGDGRTRLYAYWTADSYKTTGCYNLICAGFVQVSSKYVLGAALQPLSTYGGKQYYLDFYMHVDLENFVWWLKVQGVAVGYWPKKLFDEMWWLTRIRWGGAVLGRNTAGQHTITPMGSGHYAKEGQGKAAFFYQVQIINGTFEIALPSRERFRTFADDKGCYNSVITKEYPSFFYGGPGGLNCSTI